MKLHVEKDLLVNNYMWKLWLDSNVTVEKRETFLLRLKPLLIETKKHLKTEKNQSWIWTRDSSIVKTNLTKL